MSDPVSVTQTIDVRAQVRLGQNSRCIKQEAIKIIENCEDVSPLTLSLKNLTINSNSLILYQFII